MADRSDATRRFSNRVENYVKYRPGYPVELVDYLAKEVGLRAGSKVADVGSGTGLLSKVLLDFGCEVYGVEPNGDMRNAAEALLAGYERFVSIDGTAEETTLPDGSVDMVTVAQAFHWFDKDTTRIEFERILKPGGTAVLVWNSWEESDEAITEDYGRLLKRFGTDYTRVSHRNVSDEDFERFFAAHGHKRASFDYVQVFDWDGLQGRLLSSSYIPLAGEAGYDELLGGLREVFDAYQSEGKVRFPYKTQVYWGVLV